jgi:Tol biopolymer transport system component/DNA-binding winged helix-turn-helix (wHTH) protein
MNGQPKTTFEFCGFRLTPSEHSFNKDGLPVTLAPKAFEILVLLVENPGELVTKQDVMSAVWPDSYVEESNIQVHISAIRKALGNAELIETIPRKGYRFTGQVIAAETKPNGESAAALSADSWVPAVVKADDANLPSSGTTPTKPIRRRLRLALAFGSIGLLAIVVFGIGQRSRISAMFRRPTHFDLSRMDVRRITDTGSSFDAALSPDGKFMVYQTLDRDKFSIWLMEQATGSHVQIVPPGDQRRSGLVFSPMGDQLFFISSDKQAGSVSNLYRMPKLGGDPVKVLDGLDSPITFSPDGREFAFIRNDKKAGESSLMIGGTDGMNVRSVASRKMPNLYPSGKRPAWSPDGRSIAVIGRNGDERFLRVFVVDANDGSERSISEEKWPAVQDVAWLADSDNLLVTAQDDINFGPLQLWQVSGNGGKAEKISREVQSYVGLSMDQEAHALVSTRNEAFQNIWVQQESDFRSAKQIVTNKGSGRVDLSWTRDGRIVYTSNLDGHSNIYLMNADGSAQIQLTNDIFDKRSPVASPDGKYVIFVSSQMGPEQVWRMNLDGSDQRQLTASKTFLSPQISLDSKSVIYLSWNDAKTSVWKTSIDGGEPVLLKGELPYVPKISPDLKNIAFVQKPSDNQEMTLQVRRLADGSSVGTLKLPPGAYSNSVEWTPDSKALVYRAPQDYLINYWQQSIGGGQPRQMTDFASDFPAYCLWSYDNSKVACLRASLVRDVIMFTSNGQ